MNYPENNSSIESVNDAIDCGCSSTGCGCGCGDHDEMYDSNLPLMFRVLRPGDRVIELGCRNTENLQAFKEYIGSDGTATGIELPGVSHTETAESSNSEFRMLRAEPDAIPLEKEVADVVIASHVINRNGKAQRIVDEAYRLCDHNGVLLASDYVFIQEPPKNLLSDLSSIDGDLSGIIHFEEHMNRFVKSGFVNIEVIEARKMIFPAAILEKHIDQTTLASYSDEETEQGIFQITVIAEKPGTCESDTCCCNPDKNK